MTRPAASERDRWWWTLDERWWFWWLVLPFGSTALIAVILVLSSRWA